MRCADGFNERFRFDGQRGLWPEESLVMGFGGGGEETRRGTRAHECENTTLGKSADHELPDLCACR
jgi:hypothetical protein